MQVETQVLHIVAQVLLQAAASRASAAGQVGQDHNLLPVIELFPGAGIYDNATRLVPQNAAVGTRHDLLETDDPG